MKTKTLEQVVEFYAQKVFAEDMSGSMQPWYGIDLDIVAFIYGTDTDTLHALVKNRAEIVRNEYYNQVKNG